MTGHSKAVATTSLFHSIMLVEFKVNEMCSFGNFAIVHPKNLLINKERYFCFHLCYEVGAMALTGCLVLIG